MSVTSSNYPNRETFVHRDDFCILVEKLIKTCKRKKHYVLQKYYPDMCDYIYMVKTNATKEPMCKDMIWSPVRMGYSMHDVRIQNLEDMLYIYAKNNLVMVNVYIKEPVVTEIYRDEKTPVINFVAYTGGLLGLCMGFSLVSLFEIIYYTLKSLPWRVWLHLESSSRKRQSTADTDELSVNDIYRFVNKTFIKIQNMVIHKYSRSLKSDSSVLEYQDSEEQVHFVNNWGFLLTFTFLGY